MAQRIQLRLDTAENWTSVNPILAQGEAGYEIDTNLLKIGDGSTAWNSLSYFGGGGGLGDFASITGMPYDNTELATALNEKLNSATTPRTGTSIAFDIPATYGNSTPETDDITLDSTGFTPGIVQVLIHNASTEPAFSSPFKLIDGVYEVDVDNYIYMEGYSTTKVLMRIMQII
jgi:hypothetical protein